MNFAGIANPQRIFLKIDQGAQVTCIEQLDAFFEHLKENSIQELPDGILDINIRALQSLQLLSEDNPPASQMLQAVESKEKITLFNERFVLWISLHEKEHPPATVVYVARRLDNGIKPELAFRTKGIYNRSKTILKLIDRFLSDIQETETMLSELSGFQSPRGT